MEEPQHSSTFSLKTLTKEGEQRRSRPTGGRGGSRKSVTMTSASRYLTDRRYSVRRPLVSEQHASILKKKEREKDISRNEGNQKRLDASSFTPPELTLESFSSSPSGITSSSASQVDLRSPLGVSELRTSVRHKLRTYESPFLVKTSAQQTLSCSILEVQKLNTPLRPPLTSTVLYPSYTPLSGYSRTGLTGSGGHNKSRFSERPSKGHLLPVHQLNYWACAIPKSSPPLVDRCSQDWDPNQEYQALLDYTYPLRPEQELGEWNSSPLRTRSNLQDSGIEVDHLCSSNSLSGPCLSTSKTAQMRDRSTFSEGQRSLGQELLTEGLLLRIQVSQLDPVSLSEHSLDNSESHNHHQQAPACYPHFIRSTSVLPQGRDEGEGLYDEFWHLPLELEELKLLSRQIREVTSQWSQPIHSSWGSLGPETSSIHSSTSVTINQEAEGQGNSVKGSKKNTDHRQSEALRSKLGESVDGNASDQDVNVLAEQLCTLKSPSSWSHQDNSTQSDSLLQHIQIFCSQMELLIQQLYSLSEKMELLATPSVDSIKPSLAYQYFQGDVSSHQQLTSSVLHTGQILLNSINTTSPFLSDTLLLIEKQSGAVGAHNPFCSSVEHNPQTGGASP